MGHVKQKDIRHPKFSSFCPDWKETETALFNSGFFQMPNDFELFLVKISMNEAILRRIIDGHKPEFAVAVTLQDHAQSALKRAGKYFSQISGPELRRVSHRIDSRRGDGRSQVMTRES